jgi:hypothetical protein
MAQILRARLSGKCCNFVPSVDFLASAALGCAIVGLLGP